VSRVPPTRPKDRYGDTGSRRLALAPALLCALILLAGVVAIDSPDWYILIQFLVAILALVMGWFAVQAKTWWTLPLLAAVAIFWNPVVPLALPGAWQLAAHYVAIAVVVVAGVVIKVPDEEEQSGRRR